MARSAEGTNSTKGQTELVVPVALNCLLGENIETETCPPNVQVSNERELQVVTFGNPCPSHPRSPLNISAALELFRALRALQTLCSRVIISLPEREKAELPGASANNRNMTIKISVLVFFGLSF